ncbi:hypothetical protein [Mesomycoplasma lagogenitalium]|uniref:Uncharacterized protein n=1 Tax=Mesomycoplasma lagogenitalium TaxID=171286 RepID=A0ABY8LVR5_9BACT|nr:hypothetical protein [Mesomycoplasma lagogenitalium]WGI36885.1 hypothetical protein QEG99_01200 [Mesomycoplasma lagogenitalium]
MSTFLVFLLITIIKLFILQIILTIKLSPLKNAKSHYILALIGTFVSVVDFIGAILLLKEIKTSKMIKIS